MSGLIWIQTVWHADGIPARIFEKVNSEKKLADDKTHEKFSQHAKSLVNAW